MGDNGRPTRGPVDETFICVRFVFFPFFSSRNKKLPAARLAAWDCTLGAQNLLRLSFLPWWSPHALQQRILNVLLVGNGT